MALVDAKMDDKDEEEMLRVMRNKNEAYIPPKKDENKRVSVPENKDNEFSAQI